LSRGSDGTRVRTTIVAGILLLLVGSAAGAVASPAAFVGSWAGHWTAGSSPQPVEIVIGAASRSARIVAQFTFVTGAHSWSARREGVVVDDAARFELPGGGAIVLRAGTDSLEGTFEAPSGQLPAQRGSLVVTRVR
jgi:hypothetical protein